MHTWIIVLLVLAAIAFGAGAVVARFLVPVGLSLVAVGLFLWVATVLLPLVVK